MKGAGPRELWYRRYGRRRSGALQCLGDDAFGSSLHFLRCASRECQQQNSLGIDSIEQQMRDSMRKRVGFAGTCTSHDQQRLGNKLRAFVPTKRGRLPLRVIQVTCKVSGG
jgi:hypothetical protein